MSVPYIPFYCNSTNLKCKAYTDPGDSRLGGHLDRLIHNLFNNHNGLDTIFHTLLHLSLLLHSAQPMLNELLHLHPPFICILCDLVLL